jgi:predicted RNA-binding Zn-ribbon protein involved in translation (DUF1610 family)
LTESVALSKFACPACGGEAVWNPAKSRLVCPFCGTESTARLDRDGAIAEHDLLGALRAAPGIAGEAGTAKREVKCQSCNAISLLDPSRQAQNCEFCGSAQLVPYAETTPAHRPESVLPFTLPETEARDRIRAWYRSLWLAPSALAKKALTDTVRGVYLPYWTFDAQVDAAWTAEAGHYYYTTETYEQEDACKRGRCGMSAGSRPRAGCSTFSTTTWSARRWACTPGCCAGSSPFRRRT